MNARERNLLIALGAILAVGLSLYAGNRWFLAPLKEYNSKISDLKNDTESLQTRQDTFTKEREKLKLARLKSLPAKQPEAIAEYEQFLKRILKESNLTYDAISHTQAQDVKLVATIPNIKKTGHQSMTFTVKAKGELKQFVAAMELIQKAPIEHRVKSLTVERVQQGAGKSTDSTLVISMTIETLLVARTETRPGTVPTSDEKVLAAMQLPENRKYALIADRNIFVGGGPIIKTVEKESPPVVKKKTIPPVVVVEPWHPDIEAPRFIRMTQTVPDQQVVYLRNRAYQSDEMKLVAQKKGSDTFRLFDEDKKHEFVNFKVLKVGLREIYIQVRDRVFVMQFGQTLHDALQMPIKEKNLVWAGVKMDQEWGADEKSKAKTPMKKPGIPMRPR